MSWVSIIESLIIGPLKLLFECIFHLSNMLINNPGLSIIALSLIMNILVLPLYKRADSMQEESRNIEAKLHNGVAHIKKSFSGDERMMILQTFYRQNNYKPTHAIRGSVSLLLQIPFFMAAYNFLSNLADLQGATLGPIKDLSAPDGLIVIGSLTINILPILMTLVNIISSAIYLKGFPLKTKIQIYGMALFFLVFLYTSPAGLVFYWTLNNVFSLGKTIYYKLKNPQKLLRVLISALGFAIIGFGLFIYEGSLKKKIYVIAFGVLVQCVLVLPSVLRFYKKYFKESSAQPNKKMFLYGSLFLTILTGVLISSTVIAASPQEFVDVTHYYNPLWYILSALCLAVGTFMIWLRVFYWLATPKLKIVFDKGIWILSGAMTINYMFFGTKLGNLSPSLQYENNIVFTLIEQIINIGVLVLAGLILLLVAQKWKKITSSILIVAIVAMSAMSLINVVTINKSVKSISLEDTSTIPQFELDKNGKNVIIIMLDRAIGEYVPYILNENPKLKQQFDGFTYYSNTISYGDHTNFAFPALIGGYEYTPVELNKRHTESLVSKHNEALKVMPVLFSQNNYNVTVCDPIYADYAWIPDLSIYDDYPEINTYITKGKFNSPEQKQQTIDANLRNFFCFSLMKCMPLFIQPVLYQNGIYHMTDKAGKINFSNQIVSNLSVAKGYGNNFMESYAVLQNLSTMSTITDNNKNNFLFIANDITHSPALLQEPDYTPVYEVDNKKFDAENSHRFTINGKSLTVSNSSQMTHYHINMAAFIQIGNWLDYLKEQGVYDNSKIIIVSDHGSALFQSDELTFTDSDFSETTAQAYYPLLMVKDFNSVGFKTSDDFMTNADVPTIATQGTIENPINPFTGKAINNSEKNSHKQFIIVSDDWVITKNNGNTFLPARWISVSDNLWDKNNWDFYNNDTILNEHQFP